VGEGLETDRQGRQVDGRDIGGVFQSPVLFLRRGERGGGDPKTVEGVLVIIRAGLIADLHQGYVPIACIRKDTGALHSRGT
jgi:hypothetical protein